MSDCGNVAGWFLDHTDQITVDAALLMTLPMSVHSLQISYGKKYILVNFHLAHSFRLNLAFHRLLSDRVVPGSST